MLLDIELEKGHKDVQTLNFGLEQAVAMAAANQHEEGLGCPSRTSSITWLIYNLYRAMEARLTNCVGTQFEFSNDENRDLYPKGMAAQSPSTIGNHLGWTYPLLRFPEQASNLWQGSVKWKEKGSSFWVTYPYSYTLFWRGALQVPPSMASCLHLI